MHLKMSKLNLKIFLLSIVISALLAVAISGALAILFFLGATLAMLSVAAYSDITQLMLGQGGRFVIPGVALIIKLGIIILVIKEIGGDNPEGLLLFIFGLLLFMPAALLPGSFGSGTKQDPTA